jgi:putative addiction module CopG family antidote
MAMTALHILLPQGLRAYIDQQVASGDWGTPSEFVRELIRRDKERRMTGNGTEAPQAKRAPRRARMRRGVKSGLTVMEELMAERRAAGKVREKG